jgi:hypothetical protein
MLNEIISRFWHFTCMISICSRFESERQWILPREDKWEVSCDKTKWTLLVLIQICVTLALSITLTNTDMRISLPRFDRTFSPMYPLGVRKRICEQRTKPNLKPTYRSRFRHSFSIFPVDILPSMLVYRMEINGQSLCGISINCVKTVFFCVKH